LKFGYSTFSKVEIFFDRRCALRSLQCRRPLASRRKQTSPTAARVHCRRPKEERTRPRGGGKCNLDGWCWGPKVRAGWGHDWAVAGVPRGGEVCYLSTRGNMRLGSLFCDVRSSLRDTLKLF